MKGRRPSRQRAHISEFTDTDFVSPYAFGGSALASKVFTAPDYQEVLTWKVIGYIDDRARGGWRSKMVPKPPPNWQSVLAQVAVVLTALNGLAQTALQTSQLFI